MRQTTKEVFVVVLCLALVMAAIITAVGGVNVLASRIAAKSGELEKEKLAGTAAKQDALPVLSTAKVSWGLGRSKNELGQPSDAVSANERYGELGAHFLVGQEKVLYLTFDCGYENGFAPSILDTLREKGVKATFFLTGDYLRSEPELVAQMLAEGHVLGNHTDRHPSLPDVSESRLFDEIETLHNAVLERFGYEMVLFRFPKGEFSQQTLDAVKKLGYHSVFWSFAYADWDPANQPSREAARKKLVDALHPGAIYLLHVVSETNAAVLGDFIDAARAEGYRFGSLLPALGLQQPSETEILDGEPAA